MPQLLNLSRAARLAGVSRGQLQQRLRETNTEMFEGQMTVSDLIALYPDINLDRDPVFERLERLKQKTRPKSEYSDGWLPDAEVLMSRLKDMHRVLARTRSSLYASDKLLRETLQHLDSAVADCPASVRDTLAEIRNWLTDEIEQTAVPQDDARAELFARDAFFRILAPSVRLADTGHKFHVEGRDSILHAGIKAGLHLNYGCSSGNCGACKSRVISGKVKQTRNYDYVLSPRELESGHILACCWTAVTDVVLEAAEALKPADLPPQEIRTRVRGIERIGPDLALLNLQTPRTQTLRFMSGQSVVLTDEDGHSASYPIASCPCDGRNLQFLIRRRPDRAFAASVLDGGLPAQAVDLQGPHGNFVLEEESASPAIFIAAGDGFAPVKSLIEQAVSIDNAEWLHLYLVQEGVPVAYFHNLGRSWSDALDNFEYTALPPETEPAGLAARLTEDHPELAACEIYVAGPRQAMEPLLEALGNTPGLGDARVHELLLD